MRVDEPTTDPCPVCGGRITGFSKYEEYDHWDLTAPPVHTSEWRFKPCGDAIRGDDPRCAGWTVRGLPQ